jgi:hypothetical protein
MTGSKRDDVLHGRRLQLGHTVHLCLRRVPPVRARLVHGRRLTGHSHHRAGRHAPPTTFQLDGNATTANYFGRRNYRTTYSHFEPDQAGGCQFQGNDIPGISGGSGTALTVNLDFRGELIDTCSGNAVLTSRSWSVVGSGTVP